MHSPFNPYYLSICLELSVTLAALLASSHWVFQSVDPPATSLSSGILETNTIYSVAFPRLHWQLCRSKQKRPFHFFLHACARPFLLMPSLPSIRPPVLSHRLPARLLSLCVYLLEIIFKPLLAGAGSQRCRPAAALAATAAAVTYVSNQRLCAN